MRDCSISSGFIGSLPIYRGTFFCMRLSLSNVFSLEKGNRSSPSRLRPERAAGRVRGSRLSPARRLCRGVDHLSASKGKRCTRILACGVQGAAFGRTSTRDQHAHKPQRSISFARRIQGNSSNLYELVMESEPKEPIEEILAK